MVDSLLKDIGVDGSNIARSTIFRDASDMTRAMSEAKKLSGGGGGGGGGKDASSDGAAGGKS